MAHRAAQFIDTGQFFSKRRIAAIARQPSADRTIVADDVENQRVFASARRFRDFLQQPPHLMVGMRNERGIDFHLVRKQAALFLLQ